MPSLIGLVLNGSSRHRLRKGFLLRHAGGTEADWNRTRSLLETANRALQTHPELADFRVDGFENHPGVAVVVTPFQPLHTSQHRDGFFRRLSLASRLVVKAVRPSHHLLAAGIEPFALTPSSRNPELCADIHYIEVYDEGEVERIYNLFRQYLPELIAATANSALQNGSLQKDFSQRMRFNASSFLPRYLSQFSASRLEQLERMMRKDHGLGDLRRMDVNPLGGSVELLRREQQALLGPSVPAVELRFSDAQCSFPFLRALVVLFQAIGMQGRTLARQGRRVRYMHDEIIDGNKARAIQNGLAAMLQPDPKFAENNRRGSWYHERGVAERASASLLSLLEGPLLPSLQHLGCDVSELMPLLLGLKLRRRNQQSLANYAEYQQFLAYTQRGTPPDALLRQWEILLADPARDLVSEKNREVHPQAATAIEAEWREKLTPQPRRKGTVVWYDAEASCGEIRSGDIAYRVEARDLEAITRLSPRQVVTFQSFERRNQRLAIQVRAEQLPRQEGRVTVFNAERNFGFLVSEKDRTRYFFHVSALPPGAQVHGRERVSFEPHEQADGRWAAVSIQILQTAPASVPPKQQEETRLKGRVKWFNPERQFGRIETTDGEEIHVHRNDLISTDKLYAGQIVSFVVRQSPKGRRALRVRVETGTEPI